MGRSHMLEQSQSIWCSSECGVPMESFSLCGQLGRHTNEVDTRFFCFDILIWNYIAYRLPADAPADGVPVSFQSKREGPKPSDEQQMQIVSEVKLTQFMPANTTVDLGNIMYQYISNYLIKQLAVKYGKIVSWVIMCDWCRITPSHCVRSLMWPGHGSWTVVAFHLWHI